MSYVSYTGTKAADSGTGRVHIGVDEGSYTTYPICGALGNRDVETTDELANCPDCKRVAREKDLEHEAAALFTSWRTEREEY